MGIKIYADAGSNLFPEIIKKKNLDVKIVNMKLYIRGEEYNCYDQTFDTETISKLFYEELAGNNDIHTSLINPNDYITAFSEDVKAGHQIICLTMAKGISGTYQSACIARDIINEEQGKEVVYIVDSMTAGFGEGLLAIHLDEGVKKGMSYQELIDDIESFKYKVRSEFTVDDISFLAKTGRVNRVVAKLANLLKIKVLLKGSNDSTIESTGKTLGRKLSIKKLASQVIEFIKNAKDQIVYITHSNCLKDAEAMRDTLMSNDVPNVEVYNYDLVTGSHLGPNALAVFYVSDSR